VVTILNLSVASDPVSTVNKLIKRLLPSYTDLFTLDVISKDPQGDVFELDTAQINTTHHKIVVRGNNGVSISSGLYHYLKHYCNAQMTWGADNLIIKTAPKVEKTRIVTPYKYRYYMNTCTHGYSTVWWNWARWEREIDWMALNSINLPLAFTGQERY
jgi:alpha-N-acetylglucosaminidase